MKLNKETYQYLVAGLPELMLDDKKLSLGMYAFQEELENNLDSSDWQLAQLLFLTHDNKNVLNMLEEKQEDFDELGIFSKEAMDEMLASKDLQVFEEMPLSFEDYMCHFIACFKQAQDIFPQMNWEDQLVNYYYQFAQKKGNKFLKNWLQFDLNMRNLQAALNARKHQKDVAQKVADLSEFANYLLHSKAKDFNLSAEHAWVDTVIALYEESNLLNREHEIDKIRWEMLDELTVFNYFSIEMVMAYLIKLDMVERWINLDKEKGEAMFNRLIDELQNSYEFPKEFSI